MQALRLGITGKMGSGKSTLSRVLHENGVVILESDAVAKDIMTSDPEVRSKIIDLLGPDSYSNGALNTQFIAQKIFSDSKLRIELEQIVHPRVTDEMKVVFDAAAPHTIVGVESALVLQTDLWQSFDYIVMVDCSDEQVVNRLVGSGKYSREDILARLTEQKSVPIDLEEVDFTLTNDGTLDEFEKKAGAFATLIQLLAIQELPDIPLHQADFS